MAQADSISSPTESRRLFHSSSDVLFSPNAFLVKEEEATRWSLCRCGGEGGVIVPVWRFLLRGRRWRGGGRNNSSAEKKYKFN
jgi:hypothetical protein